MVAYMIHKFGLNPKNLEKAKKFIKKFLENGITVIYTPPIWFVGAEVSEDDIIKMCLKVIDRCDVVFVCGEADSKGTMEELAYARLNGKPVKYFKKPEDIDKFLKDA